MSIVISLAIKGTKIPYKMLLCKNGFTYHTDHTGVSRSLSTMDIYWFVLWFYTLAIKRFQFFVVALLGVALRVVGSFTTPLSWVVRGFVGLILSALNYDHGGVIPFEIYLQHFEMLRTGYALLLNICVAGWMGSDSTVGGGSTGGSTSLFQSNSPLLNALAQTLQRAFGFSSVPRVGRQQRTETRTRDLFSLNFSTEQAEALILLVGSFDYNRRAQWLLTLIMRLVVNAPDFANKRNIQEFIEDLLIVIREEEES